MRFDVRTQTRSGTRAQAEESQANSYREDVFFSILVRINKLYQNGGKAFTETLPVLEKTHTHEPFGLI